MGCCGSKPEEDPKNHKKRGSIEPDAKEAHPDAAAPTAATRKKSSKDPSPADTESKKSSNSRRSSPGPSPLPTSNKLETASTGSRHSTPGRSPVRGRSPSHHPRDLDTLNSSSSQQPALASKESWLMSPVLEESAGEQQTRKSDITVRPSSDRPSSATKKQKLGPLGAVADNSHVFVLAHTESISSAEDSFDDILLPIPLGSIEAAPGASAPPTAIVAATSGGLPSYDSLGDASPKGKQATDSFSDAMPADNAPVVKVIQRRVMTPQEAMQLFLKVSKENSRRYASTTSQSSVSGQSDGNSSMLSHGRHSPTKASIIPADAAAVIEQLLKTPTVDSNSSNGKKLQQRLENTLLMSGRQQPVQQLPLNSPNKAATGGASPFGQQQFLAPSPTTSSNMATPEHGRSPDEWLRYMGMCEGSRNSDGGIYGVMASSASPFGGPQSPMPSGRTLPEARQASSGTKPPTKARPAVKYEPPAVGNLWELHKRWSIMGDSAATNDQKATSGPTALDIIKNKASPARHRGSLGSGRKSVSEGLLSGLATVDKKLEQQPCEQTQEMEEAADVDPWASVLDVQPLSPPQTAQQPSRRPPTGRSSTDHRAKQKLMKEELSKAQLSLAREDERLCDSDEELPVEMDELFPFGNADFSDADETTTKEEHVAATANETSEEKTFSPSAHEQGSEVRTTTTAESPFRPASVHDRPRVATGGNRRPPRLSSAQMLHSTTLRNDLMREKLASRESIFSSATPTKDGSSRSSSAIGGRGNNTTGGLGLLDTEPVGEFGGVTEERMQLSFANPQLALSLSEVTARQEITLTWSDMAFHKAGNFFSKLWGAYLKMIRAALHAQYCSVMLLFTVYAEGFRRECVERSELLHRIRIVEPFEKKLTLRLIWISEKNRISSLKARTHADFRVSAADLSAQKRSADKIRWEIEKNRRDLSKRQPRLSPRAALMREICAATGTAATVEIIDPDVVALLDDASDATTAVVVPTKKLLPIRKQIQLEAEQALLASEERYRAADTQYAMQVLKGILNQFGTTSPGAVPGIPHSGAIVAKREAVARAERQKEALLESKLSEASLSHSIAPPPRPDPQEAESRKFHCETATMLFDENEERKIIRKDEDCRWDVLLGKAKDEWRIVEHHAKRQQQRRDQEAAKQAEERRREESFTKLGWIGYGAIVRARLRRVCSVVEEVKFLVARQRRDHKSLVQLEMTQRSDILQLAELTARSSFGDSYKGDSNVLISPGCLWSVEQLARETLSVEEAEAFQKGILAVHEAESAAIRALPPGKVGYRVRAATAIQAAWRGAKYRVEFIRHVRDVLILRRMARVQYKQKFRSLRELEAYHRRLIEDEEKEIDLFGIGLETARKEHLCAWKAAIQLQRVFRGHHFRAQKLIDIVEAYWQQRSKKVKEQLADSSRKREERVVELQRAHFEEERLSKAKKEEEEEDW